MDIKRILTKVFSVWQTAVSLLVAIVFIVFGCIFLFKPQRTDLVTVTCTVVEVYESPVEDEPGYTFVDYTDAAGVKHEHVAYEGFDSRWEPGSEIELCYAPEAPEVLSSTTPRWVFGVIALVVGLFCLGYTVIRTLRALA